MLRRTLAFFALLLACSLASAAQIPFFQCPGPGTGGDLASLRGIQFNVSESFTAFDVRFQGGAGNYSLNMELRRSTGFTSPVVQTVPVSFASSGAGFQTVHINLANVPVTTNTSFTVKFTNITGPGSLFFEVFGIGNQPCPNVVETDENNVANPTPRSDPAGFKIFKNEAEFASNFTPNPPRIDGVIDVGEWNLADAIPLGTHGYMVLQNDGIRLYALLNLTSDTGNDPGVGDFFYLTFDVDRDGFITPNVDKNYSLVPATGNMRYQFYLGPNVWTGLQPNTFSSRAEGYGCFFADGSLSITFPFSINCSPHRVWELAIDLAELNTGPGGFTRMGVKAVSGSPGFTENLPADLTSTFSHLLHVNLGSSGLFSFLCTGSVALDNPNAVELTQAIQTRDNMLPLVADKATAARVYVTSASTSRFCTTLSSKVNLYGSKAGVDLPGSPLAKIHSAPAIINRETLAGTANFALPSTWDSGTIDYHATARFGAGTSTSPTLTRTYTPKTVPTYWVVPVNTGTAGSPVLISNTEIQRQESYLSTIFPLKSVSFVQKPWQDLGPVSGEPITALNTYYNNNLFAWIFGLIFTGSPPFTLPAQIYGFTPAGGGLSDPVWAGGIGVSARGFQGTSLEGTYAHEVNHNLDKNSPGTWGRHVGFCGAAGPDPNWPYGNGNIQEVGFDTRLPWNAGPAQRTVVPATTPDIMTYCQSGYLPTKWISPYRWNNLFNNFTTAAADVAKVQAAAAVDAVPTFYIVGSVNDKGGGELTPIITQPGFPMATSAQGKFAIQLFGATGQSLLIHRFNVEFLDEEFVQQHTAAFNFMLPAVQGTRTIRLLNGDTLLDQIVVSRTAPTVQVVSPKKGDQWKGTARVLWEAGDADGDALSFNLLFSGDGGNTWLALADSLTGRFFDVFVNKLPGTDNGIIRVLATDGANTSTADSQPFTVVPSPPEVVITQPADGAKPTEGVLVSFQGGCSLDECSAENLVWSYSLNGGAFVNFGNGPSTDAALPVGSLTVRLIGINGSGLPGTADIHIQVRKDTDHDGIPDEEDNCVLVPNPDQRDTNGDGYGNVCDGDLDGNGIVNALDLAIFKQRFGTADPDADLDGNGIVNALDLAIFKGLFGKKPGPSGLHPQP